jgi:hypothetical protein
VRQRDSFDSSHLAMSKTPQDAVEELDRRGIFKTTKVCLMRSTSEGTIWGWTSIARLHANNELIGLVHFNHRDERISVEAFCPKQCEVR